LLTDEGKQEVDCLMSQNVSESPFEIGQCFYWD